jgi:predicted DNA-binding protein YlxM (UPF0122 family)
VRQYQKHIREKAIAAVISHEISLLQAYNTRQSSKQLRYFNSSETRESFAKVMVHATLTDQDYSVSEISKLLGVSRVAVIQMVDDTEAEGWIITRPGARKTRLCRGNQILLDMAEDWFDMYRKTAEETGYLAALRLLDNLEKVIDLEENSSRPNSL